MNTITINQFIKPFQRGSIFKGVFACDQLPNKFSLPALFVVNLSQISQPGTHWVSLFIDEWGAAIYFDSFGMPPSNIHILRFLKCHSKKSLYNKKQVQHLSSIKCGRFACVFAVSMLRKIDLKPFFARFSNNLKINDIVVEGIYSYFDVMRKGLSN